MKCKSCGTEECRDFECSSDKLCVRCLEAHLDVQNEEAFNEAYDPEDPGFNGAYNIDRKLSND